MYLGGYSLYKPTNETHFRAKTVARGIADYMNEVLLREDVRELAPEVLCALIRLHCPLCEDGRPLWNRRMARMWKWADKLSLKRRKAGYVEDWAPTLKRDLV